MTELIGIVPDYINNNVAYAVTYDFGFGGGDGYGDGYGDGEGDGHCKLWDACGDGDYYQKLKAVFFNG